MASPKLVSHKSTIDVDSGTLYVAGRCTIGANLESYSKNMMATVVHALQLAGAKLQEESVKITPLQTGELRSRAFTSDVFADKGQYSVVVGYENNDTEYLRVRPDGSTDSNRYAAKVHETDIPHRVGRWKFLETAAKQFDRNYTRGLKKLTQQVRP